MSGKRKEWKGLSEKAAGLLTGNKRLKWKGEKDRVAGKAIQAKERAKEKADEITKGSRSPGKRDSRGTKK